MALQLVISGAESGLDSGTLSGRGMDGVSCSLLLLRKDLIGKKLPMMKKGLSTETYIF